MTNKVLEDLLSDLSELAFKDGYAVARFESCDDEVVAESCLMQYKNLANKHKIPMKTVEGFDYDNFDYDYEYSDAIWTLQQTLSDEIENIIKNKIKKLIK